MTGEGQTLAAEQAREAIERTRAASAGLRARAIAGWRRFLDTFKIYRFAFIGRGISSRDSDRIATLLAGRDLLTHDDVPHSDAVDVEFERFSELIEEAKEQEGEDEGQQCLTHLYTSPVDLWRSGERWTVAEIVARAMNAQGDGAELRKALGKLGLRLKDWNDSSRRRLLVANQHVALSKFFEGTRWAGGRWVQALRYVPGTEPTDSVRFAGVQQRATAIPEAQLPRDESE